MSALVFHTRGAQVSVSGRERGWLGNLCSDALLYTLGNLDYIPAGEKLPWILKHIPKSCYLHNLYTMDRYQLISSIRTWLRVAGDPEDRLILGPDSYSLFDVQLNSAIALGGNPFKLAARLHGQCELHCYVEGPNRAWLAGMIREALSRSIYRSDAGWDAVVELLELGAIEPVVCSYSCGDSFPNRNIAEWEPPEGDEDGDSWYDLPAQERWDLAITGLRKNTRGLEMKPDEWDDYYFGSKPVSGFDFCNPTPGKHE